MPLFCRQLTHLPDYMPAPCRVTEGPFIISPRISFEVRTVAMHTRWLSSFSSHHQALPAAIITCACLACPLAAAIDSHRLSYYLPGINVHMYRSTCV